jgi:hypothetical protein
MQEPRLEFLYEIQVDLEAPQAVGRGPHGVRNIFYVRSGRFQGPRLRGEVLPGGGDWFLVRPDDVGELDVRITLRTDDGALIYVTYRGLLHPVSQVTAALAEGRELPREGYYFYIAPFFETADERYQWLNGTVAVGVGYAVPGGVRYRVFALV